MRERTVSRMCVIVVDDGNCYNERDSIKKMINSKISKWDLGVFFYDNLDEPWDIYYNGFLKISIADSFEFDNCEMFMLPDNCYYNGHTNKTPFIERMDMISDIVSTLKEQMCEVELYIGDSGTEKEDFIGMQCSVKDLANMLNENCIDNNSQDNNLHIRIENNFDY